MNAPPKNLFPLITDSHWRAMFARYRAGRGRPSAIEAEIREKVATEAQSARRVKKI
jgi:hypothetical protein